MQTLSRHSPFGCGDRRFSHTCLVCCTGEGCGEGLALAVVAPDRLVRGDDRLSSPRGGAAGRRGDAFVSNIFRLVPGVTSEDDELSGVLVTDPGSRACWRREVVVTAFDTPPPCAPSPINLVFIEGLVPPVTAKAPGLPP